MNVRGTSWGRAYYAALPLETREAIEAAIPPGHYVTIAAGTKPGDWSVRLYRDGELEPVEVIRHAHSLAWACQQVVGTVAA